MLEFNASFASGFIGLHLSISPVPSAKTFAETYFVPYLGRVEYCKPHNDPALRGRRGQGCFAGSDGSYYIWHSYGLDPFFIPGFLRVAPKYLLPDGRSIAFGPERFPYPWVYIAVDVNGQRGKSVMGVDVFMFTLKTDKIVIGGQWNALWPDTYNHQCVSGDVHLLQGCGNLLQWNGWKFPKDYPLKF